MLTRSILMAAMAATVNACIAEEATETTAQDLGPLFPIDITNDGIATPQDAVDYIHAWGIDIDTYQLTDDVFNHGASLGHRPYDWQIKTYGDPCLPAGVSRQQFPLTQIPNIMELATQLSRMPNQYLRWLGQNHFRFLIAGELGKIVKRWKGSWHGLDMNLVLFWGPSGVVGKAHFGSAVGTNADWETIDQIAFDNTAGTVSFRRVAGNERFSGNVSADGSTMSGNIVTSTGTFTLSATADYRGGATTQRQGFYRGPITQCNVDDQRDGDGNVTKFTGTWGIGLTPPAIEVMVGGVGHETTAHEVGHTINYMVDDLALGFTAADKTKLHTLFPDAGNAALHDCDSCTLVGTGYVTHYAASNGLEDFADTWGYYEYLPNHLEQRINEDLGASPASSKLYDKAQYLRRTIDTPDPGMAAAVHPATGRTYHVAAGSPPRYSIDSGAALAIPGAIATRMGAALVGDASKLWLFSVGTDNLIYQQSIDSTNHFSTPRFLGIPTNLPPTATVVGPGVIALLYVNENGTIGYRFYDSTTGNQLGSPSSMLTPAPVVRPVAAATLLSQTWLFALDATGTVQLLKVSYHPTSFTATSTWQIVAHNVFAVAAATVGSVIDIAAVGDRVRVMVSQGDAAGHLTAFHYDPKQATSPGQPAVDTTGTLYIKGFDGNYYRHPIDTTTAYTQLTGF